LVCLDMVFGVLSWCLSWSLGTVKCEGLPQLSPQAALGFDLLFNCSELGITHTPSLEKFFLIIFQGRSKEAGGQVSSAMDYRQVARWRPQSRCYSPIRVPLLSIDRVFKGDVSVNERPRRS